MHKGKGYPFAPNFWIPTGFFWPYWVSWKWKIFYANFVGFGPVNLPGAPDPWVSEAAENPSADEAIWHWPVTWSPSMDDVCIRMYSQVHLGVKYQVINFQVLLLGVEITGGFIAFDIPCDIRNFDGTTFYTSPFAPHTAVGAAHFQVASYVEGGSPWSD